jgi:hypothetical protein
MDYTEKTVSFERPKLGALMLQRQMSNWFVSWKINHNIVSVMREDKCGLQALSFITPIYTAIFTAAL